MKQIPDFLTLYSQLIALPTISSTEPEFDQSNKALIELLADWLATLGFKTEILPIENSRGKYNLLATYGEGEGGLLLAGHTDTVPFDEGRWTFDPFKLTEKDGKFYGLGTADMKGFFAFVLDAIARLDLTKLTKPLRILATADEETTMLGLSANRLHFNRCMHTRGISHKRCGLWEKAGIPAIQPKGLTPLKSCMKLPLI